MDNDTLKAGRCYPGSNSSVTFSDSKSAFTKQRSVATSSGVPLGPRNLQRLLLHSYSARCLAVRRVTQDNRGKRTAGVDGIAKIPPSTRVHMVEMLRNLHQPASPIRRVYIPKRNSPEMRPLGIPIMLAPRGHPALQALVKLAIEPGPRGHPEAKFEPNSYGFGCPLGAGRCCHDALEAIYNYIRLKPKFVLAPRGYPRYREML